VGDFRLPLRSDYDRDSDEKWVECVLCGTKRIRGLVHFTSGSVTPTSGETITGATSTDTMVITKYVLISGTFAGGDAVGIFEGTSPTGYDDGNLEIFTSGENLNGSVSGSNFATTANKGAVSISGRLIADGDIVEYQGKNYCRPHFRFKFSNDFIDETKMDIDEGDRE
jgi:hypothetical protein